jgi:hypothetical protein
MPDNVTITPGTGETIATDEIAGVQYPRTKLGFGADGSYTDVSVSAPLPTSEPAIILTGAAAQTAVVNNILEPVAGAAGTNVENIRAVSVQVVSTGTGGTFVFEQSNDNVNWRPLPVFNAELVTGVPITAAITATVSQIIYSIPIRCRFLRLRIVSAITGGSIQAFSRLATEPWTPAVATVAQPTGANLNVAGTVTANVVGQAAHDAVVTGNPVLLAGDARNANPAAVSATGDVARLITTMIGALVTKPHALQEAAWNGVASPTGASDVAIIAAAGAGLRRHTTGIVISNTGAAAATVNIRDGATTRLTITLGAGAVVPLPLDGLLVVTPNTALNVNLAAAGTVTVSAWGYTAP